MMIMDTNHINSFTGVVVQLVSLTLIVLLASQDTHHSHSQNQSLQSFQNTASSSYSLEDSLSQDDCVGQSPVLITGCVVNTQVFSY